MLSTLLTLDIAVIAGTAFGSARTISGIELIDGMAPLLLYGKQNFTCGDSLTPRLHRFACTDVRATLSSGKTGCRS
jgi:hypothetical protein